MPSSSSDFFNIEKEKIPSQKWILIQVYFLVWKHPVAAKVIFSFFLQIVTVFQCCLIYHLVSSPLCPVRFDSFPVVSHWMPVSDYFSAGTLPHIIWSWISFLKNVTIFPTSLGFFPLIFHLYGCSAHLCTLHGETSARVIKTLSIPDILWKYLNKIE